LRKGEIREDVEGENMRTYEGNNWVICPKPQTPKKKIKKG